MPGPDPAATAWSVGEEESGQRLDRHVAARMDRTRNQVQRWIRAGRVQLDGRSEPKPSVPVTVGQRIEVEPPPPEPSGIDPESGALRVLHEDSALLVIDKPPGLTVHPGAGRSTGTLAHRLIAHYPEIDGVGGPRRPGIVHRLDKDTSGVLVIARTADAYRTLQRAFARREVDKRYLALVYGAPDPETGRVDAPIGRHPRHRTRMTIRRGGRPALTRYRTLARTAGISLLELVLETGRTHQIRVHLKSIRHPIVGDPVYGEARWKGVPRAARRPLGAFPRPALHAWKIGLSHPTTREPLRFEAPPPEDMRRLWTEATGGELEV